MYVCMHKYFFKECSSSDFDLTLPCVCVGGVTSYNRLLTHTHTHHFPRSVCLFICYHSLPPSSLRYYHHHHHYIKTGAPPSHHHSPHHNNLISERVSERVNQTDITTSPSHSSPPKDKEKKKLTLE